MPGPLFGRETSFLAVIDVQDIFLDKLPKAERAPLVARIVWLIGIARALGVPVVAMAEDIPANGLPVPEVREALPEAATIFDKRAFGLTGQDDILEAVRATERPEAVLVGLETDVCVAQSALGLLSAGYRVAALSDATASPGPCHTAGLDRMRDAGVTISTVKGIYYEWVRDLGTLAGIRAAAVASLPEGLIL